MEIIERPVVFLVRDKSNNQLLACTDADFLPANRIMQFYVVDEARREVIIQYEDHGEDHAAYRFLKKGQVAKIRDNKGTRALIAELNQKIIWSQVGAASSALYTVIDMGEELLPFTTGFDRHLDRDAIEAASDELKALAKAYGLCKQATRLLNTAELTDRHILARFALHKPVTADEWTAYEKARGKK